NNPRIRSHSQAGAGLERWCRAELGMSSPWDELSIGQIVDVASTVELEGSFYRGQSGGDCVPTCCQPVRRLPGELHCTGGALLRRIVDFCRKTGPDFAV